MNRKWLTGHAPAAERAFAWMIISALLLSACFPRGFGALGSSSLPGETPTPASAALAILGDAATQPVNPLPGIDGSVPLPLPSIPPFITPAPLQNATLEGLYDLPENVNPLTGLPVADPSRLERRPVMVKISNFPRTGRPHAGLTFADIVFEYYIGYGLNRFMGVYLGQDCSQVGPVRSGRLVDAQLVEMYQGLFFYGNADPQVEEVLTGELGPRALAEKNLPSPPKYRIGKPVDETTLFVNTAELTDYYNKSGAGSNTRRDLRGMIFDDIIHPVNQPATNIGVQFWTTTRGEWHYDQKSGQYLRWIEQVKGDNETEMIPLVDRLNDKQVAFSNIIILFATYIEFAPTLHDIRLFDNTEGKRAIFFRDGVMSEGTWKTVSNGRPLQFFNGWGLPAHLKPGNTWIVIAGDHSKFDQKDPGAWDLRFDLP